MEKKEAMPGKEIRLRQCGFTLLELAIATVVLLVGVVAVMQLVPAALQSNRSNRYDTTATVVAQREFDQVINQPLSSSQFTDADGRLIQLGNSATPNVVVGGPVQMVGPFAQINFNAPAVSGYQYFYSDSNSPGSPTYEVRWAVVTTVSGTTVISKRFILGVWERSTRRFTRPVNLDSWLQK